MAFENLQTIDVADLMISRVQALCLKLRQEGFPQAANDLEDDVIKLYDDMLPFLASNDLANPALMKIADRMLQSLERVEKTTELVDFRNRIVRYFNG